MTTGAFTVISSVYPLPSARATDAEPTTPPAPPLFSMMTVCPSAALSGVCNSRATLSVDAPGGYGAMRVMGDAG